MTTDKPQDQLINFAMQELTKMFQDLKEGKEPKMSASMQTLSEAMQKMAPEKSKTMTDDEINNWAEKLNNELSKLKDIK